MKDIYGFIWTIWDRNSGCRLVVIDAADVLSELYGIEIKWRAFERCFIG